MMLSTGKHRAAGGAEAAVAIGLAVAQDENADRLTSTNAKSVPMLDRFGERADVEQAGGDGDDESGDPGGEGGRAEARMNAGRNFRQQPVAADMANQTRACPSWKTRIDEIMPMIAPMRTASRTQCRCGRRSSERRLSALTTGAASPMTLLPRDDAGEHDARRRYRGWCRRPASRRCRWACRAADFCTPRRRWRRSRSRCR